MSNIADYNSRRQEKKQTNGVAPDPLSSPSPSSPGELIDFSTGWRTSLLRENDSKDKDVPLVSCLRNLILILRYMLEWQDVLAYDTNSGVIMACKRLPWPDPRNYSLPFPWTDADTIAVADWLQSLLPEVRMFIHKDTVADAVSHVARLNPYHPIRDYLDSLTWDGEERLAFWLNTHLGVQCSTEDEYLYVQAVSRYFLISAVARIYRPGCQVDTCLILEGGQGTFKSSSLKLLFGSDWFTDQLPDIRTKDASIQLAGKWVAEFSDLSVFKETNREHLKSFLSRAIDRYRPVRGRYSIDVPRQTVFAGSTNEQFWHGDETGARRFWPVKTGFIDLKLIAEDRDQLWAEAVASYKSGCKWHLSADEEKIARGEQADRREVDAWQDLIQIFLLGRQGQETSITDILRLCIRRDSGDWSQPDQKRVARCLQALGWEKFRAGNGPHRPWKYRLAAARE